MAKKKGITDAVIDVTAGSIGLGVGSLTIGALGTSANNVHVTRIAETGQAGLGILSAGIPVGASGALLKELKKL